MVGTADLLALVRSGFSVDLSSHLSFAIRPPICGELDLSDESPLRSGRIDAGRAPIACHAPSAYRNSMVVRGRLYQADPEDLPLDRNSRPVGKVENPRSKATDDHLP